MRSRGDEIVTIVAEPVLTAVSEGAKLLRTLSVEIIYG